MESLISEVEVHILQPPIKCITTGSTPSHIIQPMSFLTPNTDTDRVTILSNILEMQKAILCFADCLATTTCSCKLSSVVGMIVGGMIAGFLAVKMMFSAISDSRILTTGYVRGCLWHAHVSVRC